MNRVSASMAHASRSTASRFTASRLTALRSIASRSTASDYSSNHDRSCPTGASLSVLDLGLGASPYTLDHGLPVHFGVETIPASKCISKLTPSWPPSAYPNSLDPGLQVHLWVHPIPVLKCISEIAASWLPTSSSRSHAGCTLIQG